MYKVLSSQSSGPSTFLSPSLLLACLLVFLFAFPQSTFAATVAAPTRLLIPSIKLNSPVEPVGENSAGEMAVPAGNTNKVGWYRYGTLPGQVGSAVFDAHVFAAFSNLKYVKPGDDLYVTTGSAGQSKKLHFIVSAVQLYALNDLSPETLFSAANKSQISLITCAGKLTPDHTTYDHRLVVYATLVG